MIAIGLGLIALSVLSVGVLGVACRVEHESVRIVSRACGVIVAGALVYTIVAIARIW